LLVDQHAIGRCGIDLPALGRAPDVPLALEQFAVGVRASLPLSREAVRRAAAEQSKEGTCGQGNNEQAMHTGVTSEYRVWTTRTVRVSKRRSLGQSRWLLAGSQSNRWLTPTRRRPSRNKSSADLQDRRAPQQARQAKSEGGAVPVPPDYLPRVEPAVWN